MLIAGHEKGQGWVRFLHSARLRGNLLTLGQIRHATIKTNDYYPLIARAVERLERSTGEDRRAVYERARKAVAQSRSNQLALLDAEITLERLALEEAIREVEAEAARKSPTETRTEPAPSEGMPDDAIFNPATTGSQLHRTEMIGRRLCRADKHLYSCPPRPMTATTPISRPSRLAKLTAPIIITMISRACAGGAVSSS